MKMIFRNKIILRKREFTGLWARKEKLIVEAHEMELQNDTKRMKREAKDMERQVAIVEVAKKRRANRDIIRLSSLWWVKMKSS